MSSKRQTWSIRIVLAVAALAGLAWLWQLDRSAKISTNILDLIPSDERVPELAVARQLASDAQSKVALFALDLPPGCEPARGVAATEAFLASLRGSPAFAEATLLHDTAARDALGRQIFSQRFDLLLPGWVDTAWREYQAAGVTEPWDAWLAARTARRLQAMLGSPEALAFQEMLPSDPLLLLPGLVGSVQGLAAQDAARTENVVLVWARTSGSPWKDEGQEPVFAAVEQAKLAAQSALPGTGVRWLSIGRIARESRTKIEQELSTLNLVSLVAVLAIALVSLRGALRALHLAPVLLGALLGAWVATTLVFDRVHVLVFVVGSLLGGVAIDYGFYLYLQPPLTEGEPYARKVGRLIKPLLSSALTTIIGFCLLLFSELPLIRQLGIFVSAGLLSALATALLWFAQVNPPYMPTRRYVQARATNVSPAVRLGARALLVLVAAVALVGPWFLRWHDDIRQLEIPLPQVQAEAAEVRALFGESSGRTVYVTRGADLASVRASLARFTQWHVETHPGATLASIGSVLPEEPAWQAVPERLTGLEKFGPALRAALEREGFEAEAFAPFFEAWDAWRAAPRVGYAETTGRLLSSLSGPLRMMAEVQPGRCWIASVSSVPANAEPPAGLGTVALSGLASMNELFGRYRVSAVRLSLWGLGLVGLSMLVLYGVWRGARIFSLPLGSCMFAFGALGLAGETLNLFHLLGAFLGVCLSHNYAIFTAENATRGEEQPPSVRLSAVTTAMSFGVLALSAIPVVKALGLTVALIVVTALAMVELLPLARKNRTD